MASGASLLRGLLSPRSLNGIIVGGRSGPARFIAASACALRRDRRAPHHSPAEFPRRPFSCSAPDHAKPRRYGMMIKLRAEHQEEYIRYHAAVWPGVLQTIRDCNISNYSIFLRDGVLFGYFEYTGEDLKADMAKMGECPETQKWWKLMKPMQQPVDNLKEDEDWWAMLEEVFHTD